MSIEKFLMEKGVKLSSKGFEYYVYACELCKKDRTFLFSVTSRLYPTIAARFKTTVSKVERAMRHARPEGWTNTEFIKFCLIEMEEEK